MTDKSAAAIREFADGLATYCSTLAFMTEGDVKQLADSFHKPLTALISEHYVSKEDAGYPLEFIEWLIKDQEIFFGELNGEYILNDNIHVHGRKLKTINELFNYWEENERC